MRILYLTPGCFDKGGISRYSRYQIAALREIIGDENIKSASLLGPDDDDFEEEFAVDWYGSAGKPTSISRAKFTLYAALQALIWRPDVIFCAHVNFTPMVQKIASLCGATTVLNVYGLELWSGLSQSRLAAMAKMNHIISDCHSTAEHVVDHGMHAASPTVIWDCVDLEKFAPGQTPDAVLARYGIPDKRKNPVILTLGRLAKAAAHKGYDRLLNNFATFVKTNSEVRLVVAGRGDMRGDLEALATSLGCSSQVVFTGSIDEEHLADIYRSATVFSLVSDKGDGRGEGIPLTPLEAMACGIPIIVGNEDGSSEAVFEGRNGFVIAPHDPSQHINALQQILQNPTQSSQAACQIAKKHFSYEGFKQKHRNFLAKL